MEVKFTRTAQRRYRVSVEGPKVVSSYMEPAPGYDTRLPHDMAHFIIENELGINGGIFGQLAAGGTARTFVPTDLQKRRKLARRGNRIASTNQKDAILSERLVALACQVWQNHVSEVPAVEGFAAEDIRRVCREFDAASAVWTRLAVGESMTLVWRGAAERTHRRSRR